MSNNFPPLPVLCWGQAITTTMRQSTTQDRPAVDSSFLFFFSASAVKGFGMHWNPLLILPSLLGVLCTHWFVYVHSGCCFRSLSDSPLQHWCRAIPRCRKITSQVGFWLENPCSIHRQNRRQRQPDLYFHRPHNTNKIIAKVRFYHRLSPLSFCPSQRNSRANCIKNVGAYNL